MNRDRTHSKQARREAAALFAAGPTLLWVLVAFAVLPGGVIFSPSLSPVFLLESSLAELPRRVAARPAAIPARTSFAAARAGSFGFSGPALPEPQTAPAVSFPAPAFEKPLELPGTLPGTCERIVLMSIDLPPPGC